MVSGCERQARLTDAVDCGGFCWLAVAPTGSYTTPPLSGISVRQPPPPLSPDCPFMDDPAGQCKAFVSYPEPIDRLLIIYAVTQKSANDPNAAAFFSEVTLACGCQCGAKAATPTTTVPIDGQPGKCRTESNASPSYACDFLGNQWCERKRTTKWLMTGSGGGACTQVPSVVSKVVSAYTPSREFGRLPEP